MRRRKDEMEAKAAKGCRDKGKGKGKTISSDRQCRRSDGRGWRCPNVKKADSSFCEKHFLQRLGYQKQHEEAINGEKKLQKKRPRVENIVSPCRNKKRPSVRIVDKTKAQSATGKGKIIEEKDKDCCSSRSTTTEKETNLSANFEVEDVASQSTRQTMGKFQDQEIGRYLRKYLASGVMEIALDYDSDYDFRKVAGLELSQ